jgi:hypothetical protein
MEDTQVKTTSFLLAIWLSLIPMGPVGFSCQAESKPHKPKLYVGVDIQRRYMSFEEGYGDNLLYHAFPQGNIYVGFRFAPNLAIETGYESTATSSRISTVETGDMAMGMLVPCAISPVVFRSNITVQNHHLSLVAFYPLFSYRAVPVEIFGSVGTAFIKATAERQALSVAGFACDRPTRTLVGRRAVARVAVGLQSQLNERLNLRVSVGWVNTSRVTLLANDSVFGIYLPTIKPKNAVSFGVGLVWNFC